MYEGPGYSPPPRPRPQRKRTSAGVIVLIVGLAIVVVCGGFGAISLGVLSATDPEPFVVGKATGSKQVDNPKLVVEITGTGPADITFQMNGTGGQENGAKLPWKKEFGPFQGFSVWSFVAQTKNGTTTGAIRIQMTYGTKVFDPCEAQGPYSIANCSGGSQ